LVIRAYNGRNKGFEDAFVNVSKLEGQPVLKWSGRTDKEGNFLIRNVDPGFYLADVTAYLNPRMPIKNAFATDYPNLNYPIVVKANLLNLNTSFAVVRIHVDHYVNSNIEGVDIFLGFDPRQRQLMGSSNQQGDFDLNLEKGNPQLFHVTAVKKNKGIMPPLASVIVEVNGRYAIANHWPPGYSYLIIPFWTLKIIPFINIFLAAIASIGVFLLARRFYSQEVAFIATCFVMTGSLALIMIYSRGMADYASMAFSTIGIALFIQSLKDWKTPYPRIGYWLGFALGLIGGLSLAAAVTMRYSTVLVLIGPFAFLILSSAKSARKKSTRSISLHSFFLALKKLAPFFLGIMIIGSMLASYNSTLFGGPFNSGYQMGNRVVLDPSGNVTIERPEKSMFEEYFQPSGEMFGNIVERIIPLLYYLLPILFLAPLALWQDRKRPETWLMFFWGLPIFIIYMQMSWVGHMYEDMRYFLPALPPVAIVASRSIEKNFLESQGKRLEALAIISLIFFSGYIMADYCINWQLRRLAGGFPMVFDPPFLAFITIISALSIFYSSIIVYGLLRKRGE